MITFTQIEQYRSSIGMELTAEWATWVAYLMSNSPTLHKTRRPYFFPGTYKKDNFESAIDEENVARKSANNILLYHAICRDFDNNYPITDAINKFKHLEFVLYTTFSHRVDHAKYRMVFPLLDRAPPSMFKTYAKSMHEYFADDRSASTVGQAFAVPCTLVVDDKHFYSYHNQGDYLDITSFTEEKLDVISPVTTPGNFPKVSPKFIYTQQFHKTDMEYISLILKLPTPSTHEQAVCMGLAMKNLDVYRDSDIIDKIYRGDLSESRRIVSIKSNHLHTKKHSFQYLMSLTAEKTTHG